MALKLQVKGKMGMKPHSNWTVFTVLTIIISLSSKLVLSEAHILSNTNETGKFYFILLLLLLLFIFKYKCCMFSRFFEVPMVILYLDSLNSRHSWLLELNADNENIF